LDKSRPAAARRSVDAAAAALVREQLLTFFAAEQDRQALQRVLVKVVHGGIFGVGAGVGLGLRLGLADAAASALIGELLLALFAAEQDRGALEHVGADPLDGRVVFGGALGGIAHATHGLSVGAAVTEVGASVVTPAAIGGLTPAEVAIRGGAASGSIGFAERSALLGGDYGSLARGGCITAGKRGDGGKGQQGNGKGLGPEHVAGQVGRPGEQFKENSRFIGTLQVATVATP